MAVAAASLVIFCEVWTTSLRGRSLGKRNVGLKVVRISDGQAPPLHESLARPAIPPATFLCASGLCASGLSASGIAMGITARWPFIYGALTWLVVLLSSLLDSQRRGWHDKLAGTVVLRRASERGNSRHERRRMTLALVPRRR